MKEKLVRIEYKVSCNLCGEKLTDVSKESLEKKLENHVDKECETVKQWKSWKKKGIYNQMMSIIRSDVIRKDVKKLLKNYSAEEIRKALEDLEIEGI